MANKDTPVLNSKVPEAPQETAGDLTKNTLENWEALVRERLNAAHKNTLENPYALTNQAPETVKTISAEALETIRKKYSSPQENSIAVNKRTPENPPQGTTADDNWPPSESPLDRAEAEKISRTAKPATRHDLPETVASRYLRIKDSYYLPDKTVAFEDRGNQLTLATENHTVIRDALTIAETRGWQRITVSGSRNFKYQVWHEASLKGMDVSGYKPTQLEVAELSQAMALREARKEAGGHPKSQGEKARQPPDGVMRGVLLAHGADHYRHDPNQGQSYYVKLDIAGKEVTRWGADFKRAFANAQTKPQIGDTVIIRNTGQQSVEIPGTALDLHSNKTVKKNTWQVEKASYQDTLQEQAEALRAGKAIAPKVIEQLPQLGAALAVAKLGEKIARQAQANGALRSQEEVDTLITLIRAGLTTALEKGQHIKAPEIQEPGQRAAREANSKSNGQKPPELVKEPQQQDRVMTR